MLETVRIALGWPARRQTIRECRRCGTEVGRQADECPTCDAADVATYTL